MASDCTQLYLNTQIPGEFLITPLKFFTQCMEEKTQNTQGCEKVAWIISHTVLGIFAYPIFGLLAGLGIGIKFVTTHCCHVERFGRGNPSPNPDITPSIPPSLPSGEETSEQIGIYQQNEEREVHAGEIQKQQEEIRHANDIQAVPGIQQKVLDVTGMIMSLSEEKQDSLVYHLKNILSIRLGDVLDSNVRHSSGVYVVDDSNEQGQIKGVILTSLKQSFLSTPLFVDDVINDFRNRDSRIAKGESFTYTLEGLRRTHKRKKAICTSTPHLDPLVQAALNVAVNANREYLLGFELDIAETQKQQQLVFSIFEKDGAEEISRTQIPESKL